VDSMVKTEQEFRRMMQTALPATESDDSYVRCPHCNKWLTSASLGQRLCMLNTVAAWLITLLMLLAGFSVYVIGMQAWKFIDSAIDARIMEAVERSNE
jgi:hypothetical protein